MKPLRQTLQRGPVVQVPRGELSDGNQRVAPRPNWSRRPSLSSEGFCSRSCALERLQCAASAANDVAMFREALKRHLLRAPELLDPESVANSRHARRTYPGGQNMNTS